MIQRLLLWLLVEKGEVTSHVRSPWLLSKFFFFLYSLHIQKVDSINRFCHVYLVYFQHFADFIFPLERHYGLMVKGCLLFSFGVTKVGYTKLLYLLYIINLDNKAVYYCTHNLSLFSFALKLPTLNTTVSRSPWSLW